MNNLLLSPARDKECPICLQDFNLLERKPMMVCIQQHLICEFCFHRQESLKDCPFCREPINRRKVSVFRERKKTLELESIGKNYKDKLNEVIKNKASAVPLRKPLLLVS